MLLHDVKDIKNGRIISGQRELTLDSEKFLTYKGVDIFKDVDSHIGQTRYYYIGSAGDKIQYLTLEEIEKRIDNNLSKDSKTKDAYSEFYKGFGLMVDDLGVIIIMGTIPIAKVKTVEEAKEKIDKIISERKINNSKNSKTKDAPHEMVYVKRERAVAEENKHWDRWSYRVGNPYSRVGGNSLPLSEIKALAKKYNWEIVLDPSTNDKKTKDSKTKDSDVVYILLENDKPVKEFADITEAKNYKEKMQRENPDKVYKESWKWGDSKAKDSVKPLAVEEIKSYFVSIGPAYAKHLSGLVTSPGMAIQRGLEVGLKLTPEGERNKNNFTMSDSKDEEDVFTQDPLTEKGKEIMGAMKKQYGEKKGEQVFYASRNKGTISGVDAKDDDIMYPEDFIQYGWNIKQNGHNIEVERNGVRFVGSPYEVVPKLQRWLADYMIEKQGRIK